MKPLLILFCLLLFCSTAFSLPVASINKVTETFSLSDTNREAGDLNIHDGNLALAQRDRWDVSTYNVFGSDYVYSGGGSSSHFSPNASRNNYSITLDQPFIAGSYWWDYNGARLTAFTESLQTVGSYHIWGDFNWTGVVDTSQRLFVYFNSYKSTSRPNPYSLKIKNFTANKWEDFAWYNDGLSAFDARYWDLNGNYIQDNNLTLRLDANTVDGTGGDVASVGMIDAWLSTNNVYDFRNVLGSKNIAKAMTYPEIISGVMITPVGFFPAETDANYFVSLGSPTLSTCVLGNKADSTFNTCVWHKINAGQTILFDSNKASELRFRIELSTTNTSITPQLTDFIVDYNTVYDSITLDINLMGDFNKFGYIKGGTDHNIWFKLSDPDNNASQYLVDANFSLSCKKGEGIVIFDDVNLATGFVHDTNLLGQGIDVNFYYSFTVSVYDFNACLILDFNQTASNIIYTKIADFNFLIDSTKPTTSWDGNHNTWQSADANVHLTCVDNNAGCVLTKYRVDTDATKTISYSAWQSYVQGILFSTDGNWAIDFNSTDNAGNVGDENVRFVLLDKTTPNLSINTPAGNTTTPTNTFSFSFNVADNASGTDANCDWNASEYDPLTGVWSPLGAYQSQNSVVAEGVCTMFFSPTTATGKRYDVNATVKDALRVGNKLRSFYIEYQPSGGIPTLPEGGGGGTIAAIITIELQNVLRLTPSSRLIGLPKGIPKTFSVLAENLSSAELPITIKVSDSIKNFFSEVEIPVTIPINSQKNFVWSVLSSEEITTPIEGVVSFVVGDKQVDVPVTIESENPLFSFLYANVMGVSVIGILIIVVIIIILWRNL